MLVSATALRRMRPIQHGKILARSRQWGHSLSRGTAVQVKLGIA